MTEAAAQITIEQISALFDAKVTSVIETKVDTLKQEIKTTFDETIDAKIAASEEKTNGALTQLQASTKKLEERLAEMSATPGSDPWCAAFDGGQPGKRRRPLDEESSSAWSGWTGLSGSQSSASSNPQAGTNNRGGDKRTVLVFGFKKKLIRQMLIDQTKDLVDSIKPQLKYKIVAFDGDKRTKLVFNGTDPESDAAAFLESTLNTAVDLEKYGYALRFRRDKGIAERAVDKVKGALWKDLTKIVEAHKAMSIELDIKWNPSSCELMLIDVATANVHVIFKIGRDVEEVGLVLGPRIGGSSPLRPHAPC